MARRGTAIIVTVLVIAAAGAALFLGLSAYVSSPAAYGRTLAQYLKALSEGDQDAALALTEGGFVNELSGLRLVPGNFRAYDFGFQGAASREVAVIRFLVITDDEQGQSAILADAELRRRGMRTLITAVRKIARGRPLVD
ncbi:MAG TPA: hypothetical protein VLH39_04915 [Magnetospirillaceae bacterium]|nr:hypothetical protein [Magnetospirillaceae bacterium]